MTSYFSLQRLTYERLPTHAERSTRPPSRQCTPKNFILAGLVLIVSGALISWSVSRLRRAPYNPLDNYQNINIVPVTTPNATHPIPPARRALVSSLYSDDYALAVSVLGHSARTANVSARLILPYLPNQVSEQALCVVRAVGWEPWAVPLILPPGNVGEVYTRFRDQYTKLNVWALDKQMGGIDRAVYVDADTLVRRNFDELFESPFSFGAVPDIYGDWRGFTIKINAGVLAVHPSSAVLEDMLEKMQVAEYPHGEAEQAFLNLYFAGTALRLPYIYNGNLAIKSRNPVLWQRLAEEMRIVHYTTVKPFFPYDITKPFPKPRLLTPEEIEKALEMGEREHDGFFSEEVGWWRTSYHSMMSEAGHVIRGCYGS
ncbi:glycosyltransferase family 8 protein [Favolaschia claudopus]|uniref:Glycosyltransferase family 8 protein n=1 Tax=Favolaschia claudopus TaxID=2862362 RepID=A0AAW0E350_9AGAR